MGKEESKMIKELFDKESIRVGRYDEYEMLEFLVKQGGYQCAIYGAGESGQLIAALLEKLYHIKPIFFIDKNKEGVVGGVPCYRIETVQNMQFENLCVVISLLQYKKVRFIQKSIDIAMYNFREKCNKLWVMSNTRIIDPFKLDWYHYINRHIEELEKTYALLEDDLSKQTMLDFLSIFITGKPYAGITMDEKNKYWGIDDDGTFFVKGLQDEVVLNLGASYGDTIYQFLKLDRPFEKVIGVEGSEIEYERCKENISALDAELKEKIQLDKYMIDDKVNTIDSLYENQRISLITMDIEGYELSALKSAENTIRVNRPVLSICAYHKKDDLITIPNYVLSVVQDYVFVLRKYPSERFFINQTGYFHIDYQQQNNELVLYAIPKERYIG